MIVAFVVLAVVCLVVLAVLVWAVVYLERDRAAARARHERDLHEQQTALMQRQAMMIEQVHETYRTVIERLGNVMNYGTIQPLAEAVATPEPTAEERLGRMIEEDTIARGVVQLTEEYKRAGIEATEEEIRADVVSMLTGASLAGPASTRGLPRD